jgi:hypothetical protein
MGAVHHAAGVDPPFAVSARTSPSLPAGEADTARPMGVGFAEALAVFGGLLLASSALGKAPRN